MNVYTLTIMDGAYPHVSVSSNWTDIWSKLLDYDTYGVGGCSCCSGGRYGHPLWQTTSEQSEALEAATSFEELLVAVTDILHNDENYDVICLVQAHAVLAPH